MPAVKPCCPRPASSGLRPLLRLSLLLSLSASPFFITNSWAEDAGRGQQGFTAGIEKLSCAFSCLE